MFGRQCPPFSKHVFLHIWSKPKPWLSLPTCSSCSFPHLSKYLIYPIAPVKNLRLGLGISLDFPLRIWSSSSKQYRFIFRYMVYCHYHHHHPILWIVAPAFRPLSCSLSSSLTLCAVARGTDWGHSPAGWPRTGWFHCSALQSASKQDRK